MPGKLVKLKILRRENRFDRLLNRLRESCSSLDKSLTLLLAELVKGQDGRAGEEEEEEEEEVVEGGDEQVAAGGDSGEKEEKDEGRVGEKKSEGEKSTPAESSKSQ